MFRVYFNNNFDFSIQEFESFDTLEDAIKFFTFIVQKKDIVGATLVKVV